MNPHELSRVGRRGVLSLMLIAWVGILGVGLAGFGAFDSGAVTWVLRAGWITGMSVVVWIIGRAAQKAIESLESAVSSGA